MGYVWSLTFPFSRKTNRHPISHQIFLSLTSNQFFTVSEDKLWCTVRALKWYLARTKSLRGEVSQIFISTTKPHGAVSPDTISRWIVKAIQSSNSEWPTTPGGSIHAHDTRAVSTSWAFMKGVPLQDILQAAAWKTPSTFTSCYLRDVMQTHGRVAQASLSSATPSGSTPQQG